MAKFFLKIFFIFGFCFLSTFLWANDSKRKAVVEVEKKDVTIEPIKTDRVVVNFNVYKYDRDKDFNKNLCLATGGLLSEENIIKFQPQYTDDQFNIAEYQIEMLKTINSAILKIKNSNNPELIIFYPSNWDSFWGNIILDILNKLNEDFQKKLKVSIFVAASSDSNVSSQWVFEESLPSFDKVAKFIDLRVYARFQNTKKSFNNSNSIDWHAFFKDFNDYNEILKNAGGPLSSCTDQTAAPYVCLGSDNLAKFEIWSNKKNILAKKLSLDELMAILQSGPVKWIFSAATQILEKEMSVPDLLAMARVKLNSEDTQEKRRGLMILSALGFLKEAVPLSLRVEMADLVISVLEKEPLELLMEEALSSLVNIKSLGSNPTAGLKKIIRIYNQYGGENRTFYGENFSVGDVELKDILLAFIFHEENNLNSNVKLILKALSETNNQIIKYELLNSILASRKKFDREASIEIASALSQLIVSNWSDSWIFRFLTVTDFTDVFSEGVWESELDQLIPWILNKKFTIPIEQGSAIRRYVEAATELGYQLPNVKRWYENAILNPDPEFILEILRTDYYSGVDKVPTFALDEGFLKINEKRKTEKDYTTYSVILEKMANNTDVYDEKFKVDINLLEEYFKNDLKYLETEARNGHTYDQNLLRSAQSVVSAFARLREREKIFMDSRKSGYY
jgi:hypothetical protein